MASNTIANLAINVSSSGAVRSINALRSSLRTVTRPIQQAQTQLTHLNRQLAVAANNTMSFRGGMNILGKGFQLLIKGLKGLLPYLLKFAAWLPLKALQGLGFVVRKLATVGLSLLTSSFKLLGGVLKKVGTLVAFTVKGFFGLLGAIFKKVTALTKLNDIFKKFLLLLSTMELKRLADQYLNTTNRLRLAVEHQKDFANALALTYKISRKTRSELYSTADLYTRIAMVTRKLGVDQNQLARVVESVQKAVVISGADFVTARGALIQLGQAFSIGVLRGDEFRSVQEALPGLLDQVSRRLGVTRGELREMAYQGKVTSEVLMRTILESTKAIDEQFARVKPTIAGAFAVVKNAVMVFIGRVSEAMDANQRLFDFIVKIADKLNDIQSTTIDAFAKSVEFIFTRLGNIFSALLADFGKLTGEIDKALNKLLGDGYNQLDLFDKALLGLHYGLSTVVNFLDYLRKALPAAIKIGWAYAETIYKNIGNLMTVTVAYLNQVKKGLMGMLSGIGFSFEDLFDYIINGINSTIAATNQLLEYFDLFRVPLKMLRSILEVNEYLVSLLPGVTKETETLGKQAIRNINAMLGETPQYIQEIGEAGVEAFDAVAKKIEGFGAALKTVFTADTTLWSAEQREALKKLGESYDELQVKTAPMKKAITEGWVTFEQEQGTIPGEVSELAKMLAKPGEGVQQAEAGKAGEYVGKPFWEHFSGQFQKAFEKKGGAEVMALKAAGGFMEGIGNYFRAKEGLEEYGDLPRGAQDARGLSADEKSVQEGSDIIDIAAGAMKAVFSGDPTKVLVEILMKLDVVKKILENVVNVILKPLNAIFSFLMPILEELGDFISAIAEGIEGMLKPLMAALRPFQGLIRLFGGFIKNLLKSISQLFRPIAALLERLTPVIEALNPILQAIGKVFSTFMSFLGQAVSWLIGSNGAMESTYDLLVMEQEIIQGLQDSSKELEASLKSIDDAIKSITESALNLASPAQKLEDAKTKYLDLFAAASASGAEQADIEEFASFSKTYLQQAQDVLRSSGAYVDIYDAVLKDLDQIGDATFSQSTAVNDFNRANVELQAIGSTIEFDLTDNFTNLIDEVGEHLKRLKSELRDYEIAEYGDLTPGQIASIIDNNEHLEYGPYKSFVGLLPDGTTVIGGSGSGGRSGGRSLSGTTTEQYEFKKEEKESTGGTEGGFSGADVGEMAGSLLTALIDGIVNAITGFLDIVAAFGQFLSDVIIDFITGSLNALAAVGKFLSDVLLPLISGALNILDALGKFIKDVIVAYVSGYVAAAAAFTKFLTDFVKTIVSGTLDALAAIGKFLALIVGAAASGLAAIGKLIGAIIGNAASGLEALAGFYEKVLGLAASGLAAIGAFLVKVLAAAVSGLAALAEFYAKVLGAAASGLEALGKLIAKIVEKAASGLEAIGKFLAAIIDKVTSAYAAIAAFISSLIDKAITGVAAIAQFIMRIVRGVMMAYQAFASIITTLISSAISAGDALSSFFTTIISGTAAGISSVITTLFNLLFGSSGSTSGLDEFVKKLINMVTFTSDIGEIPIIPGWLFGQSGNILGVEFFPDLKEKGEGGGLAVGPSHQSGILGTTKDGAPFLFEGGEYIINKKSAEKIGSGNLHALNSMGSGGTILGGNDLFNIIGHGFQKGIDWTHEPPWWAKKYLGLDSKFGVSANIGALNKPIKKHPDDWFNGELGVWTGGIPPGRDMNVSFGSGGRLDLGGPGEGFKMIRNNAQAIGPIPLEGRARTGRIPFTQHGYEAGYKLSFPWNMDESHAYMGKYDVEGKHTGGFGWELFNKLFLGIGLENMGLLGLLSKFAGSAANPLNPQMWIDTFGYIFGMDENMTDDERKELREKGDARGYDKKGLLLPVQDYLDRGFWKDIQGIGKGIFDPEAGGMLWQLQDFLQGSGGFEDIIAKTREFIKFTGLHFGSDYGRGGKIKSFQSGGFLDEFMDALGGLSQMGWKKLQQNLGGGAQAFGTDVGRLDKAIGFGPMMHALISPNWTRGEGWGDIDTSGPGVLEFLSESFMNLLKFADSPGTALTRGVGGAGAGGAAHGIYKRNIGRSKPGPDGSNFVTGTRAWSGTARALGYDHPGAYTIDDLIIFRESDMSKIRDWVWAHELGHVRQYRQYSGSRGDRITAFMGDYLNDPDKYERDASTWASQQGTRIRDQLWHQKRQGYSTGGMVYGPSHAQGGVLAELEGGEYVVPKRRMKMYQSGTMVTTGGGYESRTSGSGEDPMAQFIDSIGGGAAAMSSATYNIDGLVSAISGDEGLIGYVTQLVGAIGGGEGLIFQNAEQAKAIGSLVTSLVSETETGEQGLIPSIAAITTELVGEEGLLASVTENIKINTEVQQSMALALIAYDEQQKKILELNANMTLFYLGPLAWMYAAVKNNAEWLNHMSRNLQAVQHKLEQAGHVIGALVTPAGQLKRLFESISLPSWLTGGGDGGKKRTLDPRSWFAEGGPVYGPSHSSGGVLANLEGGEYVINRESAAAVGTGFLDSVNSYQSGGTVTTGGPSQIVVNVYTDLEGQTKAAVSDFRTEISERQSRSL